MRILNVVGARPNLVKMAALVKEMRRHSDLEALLVHTGQHYDDSMSESFFRQLGIPPADFSLGVGSASGITQTAQIMLAMEPLVGQVRPDLVVVVGDVNSTLAAAVVAARLQVKLAHVEAGLRSFDRAMPEETNRVLTDHLADYLFATERSGVENLAREGIPAERTFLVGNVMIDTLLDNRARADELGMPARFGLKPGSFAFMTLHRPSNVDDPVVLGRLLDAVETLQKRLPIVFALHPRTRRRLDELALWERANAMGGVHWQAPLGYLETIGLVSRAALVLTDSGGLQEEATVLGVPCLTLRENTERPSTVNQGTNQIVGTSTERILAAAGEILDGKVSPAALPELWDGHAAERIVAILRDRRPPA